MSTAKPDAGRLVLDYRTASPRASRHARRLRAAMLVVAILAVHLAAVLILHPVFAVHAAQSAMGGGVIGTPFSPTLPTAHTGPDGVIDNEDELLLRQYTPRACAYLTLFLLTQWWFLSPRGSWRIAVAPGAAVPPPRRAAIAAGFIGMLLCIGLIATILELPDWWIALTTKNGLNTSQQFGGVWITMAVLWAFWSVVFMSYWRSLDRYTALRRVFRWLLAGTVLEMLIAAPAHAWIIAERGGDCYCQRGTWTGVAFGCTAALWLFGPGALLLFLREKTRREQFMDAIPTASPATTSAT